MRCRGSGKRKRRSAWGELIPATGFDDAACGGERDQTFVETGGANAAYPAQYGDRHLPIGVCECGDDAIVEGSRRRCLRAMPFDGLKCQRIGAVGEFEREGGIAGAARCSTVRVISPACGSPSRRR